MLTWNISIGQGIHKRNDISHFLFGQFKVAELIVIDILCHLRRSKTSIISFVIKLHYFFEGLEDSVVEIRSGDGNVSKRRHFKLAILG